MKIYAKDFLSTGKGVQAQQRVERTRSNQKKRRTARTPNPRKNDPRFFSGL